MQWLARQHEQKALIVPDSECAASLLFWMAVGEPQMRLLIGDLQEPDEALIDERVKQAVDIFLKGALPRVS
jgi:hypothetical protein